MAHAIIEGAQNAGAHAALFHARSFDADRLTGYEGIALGCPAMGAEELEDTEFLPMYEGIKDALQGKKLALFGSYGWGDGEWMRNWQRELQGLGYTLVADGLILNETPDDEGLANCRELGSMLA
jgi:flavodoxin short chain